MNMPRPKVFRLGEDGATEMRGVTLDSLPGAIDEMNSAIVDISEDTCARGELPKARVATLKVTSLPVLNKETGMWRKEVWFEVATKIPAVYGETLVAQEHDGQLVLPLVDDAQERET